MLRQAVDPALPSPSRAPGPIDTVILDEFPDGSSLRSEWNRVADAMDPPSPFVSYEWTLSWWRHIAPQRRGGERPPLRLVCFRRDGELVGVAPFYERVAGVTPYHWTMLLPLGWEPGRGWSMSEQLELLFPAADRLALLDGLAAWLAGHRRVMAVLPGMQDEGDHNAWLAAHRVSTGHATQYPFRELPATFEDLLPRLNKSLRDNVKYYPRLLHREGHDMRFVEAGTAGEMAAALPQLYRLHSARAAATAGPRHDDYFAVAGRRAFFDEVMPALAAQGRARLGILHVDGSPVAAQAWFENASVMFLYYSGHDPAWSRYSVGLITTVEAMRSAMRRGVRRLELLAGLGHFKERWDPQIRTRHNVTVATHPRIPRLVAGATTVRRVLRRLS